MSFDVNEGNAELEGVDRPVADQRLLVRVVVLHVVVREQDDGSVRSLNGSIENKVLLKIFILFWCVPFGYLYYNFFFVKSLALLSFHLISGTRIRTHNSRLQVFSLNHETLAPCLVLLILHF